MLTKRQKKLLSLLKDEPAWQKSTVLAAKLNVTTRTVRNDVNVVNYEHEGLIESSSLGYRISPSAELPDSFYNSSRYSGPEERITYLLSSLLTAEGEVDLYDLADDLYVSYQTIDKDAKQLEKELDKYGLTLQKKASIASVAGSESNRRRMLSRLVYSELNENLHEMTTYRGYLEDAELYTIKKLLMEVFTENGISTNEYTLNSLMLHIAIAINRIRTGSIINDEEYSRTSIDGYEEYLLAKKIAARVEQQFGVDIPLEEVCSIAYHLLGKTKADYSGFSIDTIHQVMDESFISLAKELLADVKEAYDIDIYSDSTFIRYLVHIRDLVIRARNGQSIQNPMKERFKNAYPMIYDIAVFVAQRIREKLGYQIGEDEIAYLAIHIGAGLEHNRIKEGYEGRAKTLIVCPQYPASREFIEAALAKRVGDSVYVMGTNNTLLPDYAVTGADMILTTIELPPSSKAPNQEVVLINPFPKGEDFVRIEAALENLRRRKMRTEFAQNALNWFDEKLYFTNQNCENEWDVIEYIGARLRQQGYVDDEFIAHVRKREQLSSTTYGGGFAIPHSVEMDAGKTCIAVMQCPKPIRWGEFTVSIVFLFAINKNNRKGFIDFYETLATLFLKPENLEQLHNAEDFKGFIQRLGDLL